MRNPTLPTHAVIALAFGTQIAFGIQLMSVETVRAAEKSAVSPDIVMPAPVESAAPAEAIAAPIPPAVEVQIQPRSSTPTSVTEERPPSERPTIEINPRHLAGSQSSPAAGRVESDRIEPERVEVVMENRVSGCRASITDVERIAANPCAPVASRRYVGGDRRDYRNSNGGALAAQVRTLSPREIRAMSLPGNGNKQMLFPLPFPVEIGSNFGYRIHPITKEARFHQGTDLAAAEGTPVLAALSGKVEVAGWMGGLGIAVVLSHGDRQETRYGHLSEVFVRPGQWVEQGTAIGAVGSTGFSTGPHLHFEVWQKLGEEWLAVDPTVQIVASLARLNVYLARAIP